MPQQHGVLLPTRGVVLQASDAEEVEGAAEHNILHLARTAENRGFDGVWVGDSVLAKPRLEALQVLAAVAQVTKNVTLGTAVYLPNLRHPVNVAHQTSTLDLLSQGRLVLGVGVGSGSDVEAEHDQIGVSYPQRGVLLNETLEVINGLWKTEPFSFQGSFFEVDEASIGFQPVEKPPVYLATAGYRAASGFTDQMMGRFVRWGDGWMPIATPPEDYRQGLQTLRTELDRAGRNPEDFTGAYYQDVVLASTEEDALEQAREFHAAYYPAWGDLSDDQLKAFGVFGPPSRVSEHLQRYREAGVETFITRLSTARNQHQQLERLAELLPESR